MENMSNQISVRFTLNSVKRFFPILQRVQVFGHFQVIPVDLIHLTAQVKRIEWESVDYDKFIVQHVIDVSVGEKLFSDYDTYGYTVIFPRILLESPTRTLDTADTGLLWGNQVLGAGSCLGETPQPNQTPPIECRIFADMRDQLEIVLDLEGAVATQEPQCRIRFIFVRYWDTAETEFFNNPDDFKTHYRHSQANMNNPTSILYARNQLMNNPLFQNVFFRNDNNLNCSDIKTLPDNALQPVFPRLSDISSYANLDITETYLYQNLREKQTKWKGELTSFVNGVLQNSLPFQEFGDLVDLVRKQCPNPVYQEKLSAREKNHIPLVLGLLSSSLVIIIGVLFWFWFSTTGSTARIKQ